VPDADAPRELPAVTFSTFVVSLATSAMGNMGEGPSGTMDLDIARHSIDILGLLRDKTKGNLDDEESKLLETVLYEARMKYLEKTRALA
jgi:hypothetical protein